MEKKLASIEIVESLTPAANADNLEIVTLAGMGWNIVAKKGIHKVGDKVLFIPIDTVLQRKPWNEFLFKAESKDTEVRLRSVKLRGNISQGIVIPFAEVPEIKRLRKIGVDISNKVGVRKYTKVHDTEQGKKRNWLFNFLRKIAWKLGLIRPKRGESKEYPGFLTKTDEDSLQTKPGILEEFSKHDDIYITLKADGCLSGDTMISTKSGLVQLSDIITSPDDYEVASFNLETGKVEYTKITAHRILQNDNNWYLVELEDGRQVVATGNHPFYLPELGVYRQCTDIIIGDSVLVK